MEKDRLRKTAEAVNQQGRVKRDRHQLKCEDCVKRDVGKAEDESGGRRLSTRSNGKG